MSLINEIERLGALVSAKEMTLTDAAHRLAEFSDGGLTQAGAADLLGSWRTARARYERISVGTTAGEGTRP